MPPNMRPGVIARQRLAASRGPLYSTTMEMWRQFMQALEAAPPLSIPLWQILLFIVTISLASLWERYRLILLLAYLFAFHWVFIENLRLLALNRVSAFTVLVFAGFGIITLILTIYHATTSSNRT